MSMPSSPKRYRTTFLDLPLELREEVYKHYAMVNVHIQLIPSHLWDLWPTEPMKLASSPSLFRTSKQIYIECQHVYFKNVTVRTQDIWQYPVVDMILQTALSSIALQSVQALECQLCLLVTVRCDWDDDVAYDPLDAMQ